jgi:acetylornithine deacetylase/succinyl-diaminopimelate desuccinylase-like protein
MPFGMPGLSTPSALHGEVMTAIEKLSAEFWPGVPVIPLMCPGGTDSAYLRNAGIAAYGHSGLADDVDDFRAHGKDQRVPVRSFRDGHEYLYRLVKMLAGGH